MTLSNPAQYISGRTVQEQMNSLIDYVDQRAAEVASDEAQQVLQPAEDAKDAAIQAKDDAQAAQAAAEQAVTDAATVLTNAVKKTGESSQSIAGNISVSGNLAVGGTSAFTGTVTVPAPLGNTNAATKKYVDDVDALDVHLAGSETITGVKSVPLETTGVFSNQIASSNKVKNELDNYAPMVRTANDQTLGGVKSLNKQGSGLVNILKRHRTITGDEVAASTIWTEVATFTSGYQHMKIRMTRCYGNSDAIMEGLISVQGTTIGTCKFFDVYNNTSSIGFEAGSIIVAIDSTNTVHVFMKMVKSGSTTYASTAFEILSVFNPFSDALFKFDPSSITLPGTNPVAEPQQADYTGYKVMS